MLKLAGIVHDSIVDGPGMRIVLFTQGCPHHCEGCHNPETWDFDAGVSLTLEDILKEIESNPMCRGITFSGGEPFAQAGELAKLAGVLKSRGYEVASYSGYTFEQLLKGTDDQKKLLRMIDVLIDGPYQPEYRSLNLNFRGSSNQRVLNVPRSLQTGTAAAETSARWLCDY
ncbi:MAG: anaerobic ribonucleoside-triphosphate reductase activating protein [Lachnospiraceae bacterium]|nr:anaerobic ribonucleoside-triphosphate reductase activating protein [Lachnospiraceae bacterium]